MSNRNLLQELTDQLKKFRISSSIHKSFKEYFSSFIAVGDESFALKFEFMKWIMAEFNQGNDAKSIALCKISTGAHVAITIELKDDDIIAPLQTYLKIRKQLPKQIIVQLLEVFENEYYLFSVYEYASGGELTSYLSSLKSEEKARPIFKQILNIVKQLHNAGFVHFDLKPHNLLFRDENKHELILADFEFCVEKDVVAVPTKGTPFYQAPETAQYGIQAIDLTKADVYSLGVILLDMIYGSPAGESHKGVIPTTTEISTECYKLIKNMTIYNVENRYSIAQIENDPWLTK